uniref:Uncharacterized protein n=1 Tax=Siphoviridae sp. ctuUw41 TaxID=2826503 RepID=A0A8S5MYF0_9CAUD|nr:MAG TPA: hypothetical protein [Siphoviridae sp. ctuUw41]
MKNTQITVDCNNLHEPLENLQSGDFFLAKDDYDDIFMYLYIDNDCIIDIEEGTKVDKDYFSQYEEIRIVKKLKIIAEE